MTDFGTFALDAVIMHTVPGGLRDEKAPDPIEYSEAPIELDPVPRGYIQKRLRSTLGGRARPVIEEPTIKSPTPGVVRGLVAGTGDFVKDSQELARELHKRQHRISPIGLLMMIEGKLDGERCYVIAKLEREEGIQVEHTVTAEGLRTYKADYLQNLVFSDKTRVFKAGVFKASEAAGTKLAGNVVDDQLSAGSVADYYLEFLGCEFVQRPDRLTEQFFTETQRWIHKATKGRPEKTAEYEIALLAEMQSNARRLKPTAFAQQHLDKDDRDEFLAVMTAATIPHGGFVKDVDLIKGSIKRIKVQTRRGAAVFAPPEMHEDGSLSVEGGEGKGKPSRITLTDEITGMSGAGGGGAAARGK